MDLRQIQYFVTLFEERNVTKAARRLNVVQPALSMQIRRLEQQFKTALFERNSRGVEPTAVGRNLYRMCLQILDGVHGAELYLREASGKITGEVTIGLMPSVAASVLAPVLLQYAAQYPDVRLRLIEAYSGSLLEGLMAGMMDFAIVNKEARVTGVGVLPLFQDRLVLVTSRQMLPRVTGAFPARRLPELKLVLPSTRQGMRRLLDSMLRESGIVIEPQIELDSLGATLELVRQSDWVTVLPVTAVQRAVAAKLVRALTITGPEINREVVVAYSAQRPPTLAGKLFVELLGKGFEELTRLPE